MRLVLPTIALVALCAVAPMHASSLEEARRTYDIALAERLFKELPDAPGTGDELYAVEVCLLVAELERIEFENADQGAGSRRRSIGERVDEAAQRGLSFLETMPESSETLRLEADLLGTLMRSRFRGKKHRSRMERAARRAIELDPENARARVSLAKPLLFAHGRDTDDVRSGLALIREATALDPTLEPARLLEARALEELGRRAEAEPILEEVLARNPDCAPAASRLKGQLRSTRVLRLCQQEAERTAQKQEWVLAAMRGSSTLTRNVLTTLTALVVLDVASALAETVQLPSGTISGLAIDDRGEALVVLTPEPFDPSEGSLLYRFGRTDAKSVHIEGIAVNRFEILDEETFLVSGQVVGERYARKVLRLKGDDELEMIWDSSDLPKELHEGVLEVSVEHDLWGVMTADHIDRFTLSFGSLDSYEVKRSRTITQVEGSIGSSDSFDFQFLSSSAESLTLAVEFNDEVFIIRLTSAGVHSERLERGDHGLYEVKWQPRTRTLWADWGDEWYSYDLWDFGMSAESTIPSMDDRRPAGSRHLANYCDAGPQPSGAFVVFEEEGGGYRIEYQSQVYGTKVGTSESLAEKARFSPKGNYALLINGWSDTTAEIIRLY